MHFFKSDALFFFEKVMHVSFSEMRYLRTNGVPIPKKMMHFLSLAPQRSDARFCLSQLLRLGFLFFLHPTTPHMSGGAADDSTPTSTMLAFVGPGG